MFKKIMSLAIALMLVLSVAAVGFSAAQVEITDEAADSEVADQAANGDAASLGAEDDVAATGADVLKFDANSIGWSGMKAVQFYVYSMDTGAELLPWGGKKLNGTDDGSNVWTYEPAANGMNIEAGKQYGIIFVNADTKEQTYDLLMDTSCFGDTAKSTGTDIENPVDSSKTTKEAVWTNNALGPRLQITSIGNVVGKTIPASTSAYGMLVRFLASKGKDGLQNAVNNGKEVQATIDSVANTLGLKKGDVKDAIKEAAGANDYSTDSTDWSSQWDESKSSLADGTSEDAHKKGDGSSDGSDSSSSDNSSSDNSSSNNSNSGNSTGGSSSSSSSSGTTGSASNTQTGQTETVLFIMLGVMVAAAGVIFFVRKRERA